MVKIISIVLSVFLGSGLAVGTSKLIQWSATKAPSNNPANSQIVDYGNR